MAQNVNNDKTTLSIKSIISQALAGSAQNLILLDLGMAVSIPTLIIPALLGAKEGLSFTVLEASWFGSTNLILQPIGSILSGVILEPLGRKKALLVVNIPHIIAWLMLFLGQNVSTLFCANALLGLGNGFMEAPTLTYVGEMSHSSLRGILTAYSQLFTNLGIFVAYFLGLVMDWRTASACCLAMPLASFVAVLFIPETPIWLLSKGRKEDALKALCWLRGWTKPSNVQDEFDDLLLYREKSLNCDCCASLKLKGYDISLLECTHKRIRSIDAIKNHFKDICRKEVMRPLSIVVLMFLFQQTTGLWGIAPNMVNIYNCFGMAIDGHVAVVATGAIGLFGVILAMILVKKLGKRFLSLVSLLICAVCTLILGIYAYIYLPDANSYDEVIIFTGTLYWLPMLMFACWNLAASVGLNTIPWLMLSEIFPLRGRGMACGVGAAFCYIFGTIVTKTYYDLEKSVGIYGAMWFYAFCSILGCITMYFLMPETEGKPLQEIENYFGDKYIPIFAYDRISNKIFKNRQPARRDTSKKQLSGYDNNSVNVSTIDDMSSL